MGLTILGLPLGNIKDISLRAIETLKEANVIICEDTRMFGSLWSKLSNLDYLEGKFGGKLEILNDFNEKGKTEYLANKIIGFEGKVVLVSDAGMPTLSDPGFRLINLLIEKGIKIDVVPGPTALTTALAVSGLSSDRVIFLGFLPKKDIKRERVWEEVKKLSDISVVLYESPTRVKETLEEISKVFGAETKTVVARELTKEYEEVMRGTVAELIAKTDAVRGEVVVLFRV